MTLPHFTPCCQRFLALGLMLSKSNLALYIHYLSGWGADPHPHFTSKSSMIDTRQLRSWGSPPGWHQPRPGDPSPRGPRRVAAPGMRVRSLPPVTRRLLSYRNQSKSMHCGLTQDKSVPGLAVDSSGHSQNSGNYLERRR